MHFFSFFLVFTEEQFRVAAKVFRDLQAKYPGSIPFSSRLRSLRGSDEWSRRFAYPPFKAEYERRTGEFAAVLARVRRANRALFIDAAFLREISPLLEFRALELITVLFADILKAWGNEREAWTKYISYISLVQAPPDHIDLREIGLDGLSLRDLAPVNFKITNDTQGVLEQAYAEFRNMPWLSFVHDMAAMVMAWTGAIDLPALEAGTRANSHLDDFSLLHDSRIRFHAGPRAFDDLVRQVRVSSAIDPRVKEYLEATFSKPAPTVKREPGRPTTVRLAWMRRAAARGGWKWTEFKWYYGYDQLDETGRSALEEEIREVLKKSPRR